MSLNLGEKDWPRRFLGRVGGANVDIPNRDVNKGRVQATSDLFFAQLPLLPINSLDTGLRRV